MPGFGWRRNIANSRLDIQVDGTVVGQLTTTTVTLPAGIGLTLTDTGLTVTAGGVTVTDGGVVVRGDARLRESMGLANVTTVGDATYTAAQLVGGVITRDPAGAGRTDTTATGTDIETELNAQGIDVATGDTFVCWLINTADAAEAITLAAGTGVTLSNVGQTLAQNESALLLFRRTAANTFTCYIVGA